MTNPTTSDELTSDDLRIVNRQMLSVPQVATYMNVSQATVRRWIKGGLVPFVKIGTRYRIPAATFAAEYVNQPVETSEDEVRERLIAIITHVSGTEYDIDGVATVSRDVDNL